LNTQTAREAFVLGCQLAELPPDTGFEILRDNWSKLTSVPVRQQMLKAFFYTLPFPLRARNHPRGLAVFHLGATDPSMEVRESAFHFISQVALRSFEADSAGYARWYAEFGGRSPQEATAASTERVLNVMAAAKGVPGRLAALESLDLLPNDAAPSPATAGSLADRQLQIIGAWLVEPALDAQLAGACFRVLDRLRPDERFLKRCVLPLLERGRPSAVQAGALRTLGKPENAWAFEPLSATLTRIARGTDAEGDLVAAAASLGRLRDPRAIPLLIGVLAVDDTEATRSTVNSALGLLTGAETNASHNQRWWLKWWSAKRASLPEPVRSSPIPDLAARPNPEEAEAARKDPRVRWIREHASSIRSIDPDDDDFADLQPLAARIGKSRIVLLGEQSHGDGATFYAKARLIRFLHRKLGFDVLAWESGLFDCRQMERALHTDRPLKQAIAEGIFPIWGESAHILPVFEYARSTHKSKRPLEMAGFDCQFSARNSGEAFARELRAFCEANPRIAISEERRRAVLELATAVAGGKYKPVPDKQAEGREAVAALIAALDAGGNGAGGPERGHWKQTLQSLLVLETIAASRASGAEPHINVRDRAMAENLIWLSEHQFPKRKIIVWAASFHTLRNASEIEVVDRSLSYAGTVPMGHTVWERLGKRTYSIAFTAYAGSAGNPFFSASRLTPSGRGSLEWLFHHSGLSNAFVDLRGIPRGHWLRTPLVARPLGYKEMRADWSRAFDAIVFTDRMFPSTRDGDVPEGVLTAHTRQNAPAYADSLNALLEFRRLLVVHGLTWSGVLAPDLTRPDPGRMALYEGTDVWPSLVTLSPVPSARRFQRLHNDGRGDDGDEGGGIILNGRLSTRLSLRSRRTVLCPDGIGASGAIESRSYTNLYSADVAGQLTFGGYAAAVVKGDLTGSMTAESYFSGLVTGVLRGKYTARTASSLYILGGLAGELELGARAKVYVAGRTSEAALAGVRGAGTIWLEHSDLPVGEHRREGVRVIVLGQNSGQVALAR